MKQKLTIEIDVPDGYVATGYGPVQYREFYLEDGGRVLRSGILEPSICSKVILSPLHPDPEPGEVVEVSDDGVDWFLGVYDPDKEDIMFLRDVYPFCIYNAGANPERPNHCWGQFKYCRKVEPTERYEMKREYDILDPDKTYVIKKYPLGGPDGFKFVGTFALYEETEE